MTKKITLKMRIFQMTWGKTKLLNKLVLSIGFGPSLRPKIMGKIET